VIYSKALTYREFGEPAEVLEFDNISCAVLKPETVHLQLLAAVIQPSDRGMIQGSYGKLKSLPAVAGREAVARVVAVGDAVENVKPGEWVRFPEQEGTWQTNCVVAAKDLWKIPEGISIEMAAMAFINPPTAWRILRDANLQEGDWVLQNAANSAVGQFVIQMAHSLGFKTINVVRKEDYIAPLKALGADHVLLEDSGYEKQIADLTNGAGVRLALNSIGGSSALRQIKALGFGGRQVTFGAMSAEAIRFPTRQLIFNQVKLSGFWLDNWYRQNSRDRVQIMMDRIFALMKEGNIKAPVAGTFLLSQYKDALIADQQPKLGKILLVPDSE
jgi:NADPH:quinone reductase-like Zn-dependent oxidoreductase